MSRVEQLSEPLSVAAAHRVVADNCVPTAVIEALRGAGHEVLRVVDLAHQALEDRSVARLAARCEAPLVTCDNDFRVQRSFPYRRFSGIILLREYQRDPERIVRRLLRLLNGAQPGSLAGTLTVIDTRSSHQRK